MKIGILPGSQNQTEYGYPRQMDVTYLVEISYAESAGLSQHMLHRVVESQTEFLQFDSVRSTCIEETETGYVFQVQGSVLQNAFSQRNFVYKYATGLTNEQRGVDIFGRLNTVQYPAYTELADITTALVDVPVSVYEIQATGIRDLGRYASSITDPVMAFQYIWQDKVNSSYWKGVPARQALCTAVQCDPLYLKGNQYVYAITFRFSIKTQEIHDPWIYYTDANGKVPGDVNYAVGTFDDMDASYRHSKQFHDLDFNTQFPIGSDL